MTTTDASDAVLDDLKRLHPVLIDLSLDRIRGLMDRLGRPQDCLPAVIHVAGTNGKGSTIAFMQAILQADGKRVHTYTSPHLVRFHERIQLADDTGTTRPITDDQLVALLDHVRAINDGAPMTFFEITTAAALLAFAETPADIVLLEVGLGGRLDATNIINTPALSVITPISIDHADKLGDSLAQIAFEKAGILKPGIPAIIGPQHPDAMTSIEQAARRTNTTLICFGRDFDAFEERGRLVYQAEHRLLDLPLPALIGRSQITNAGTALAAILTMTGAATPTEALEQGLRSARWPARFSRLCPRQIGLGDADETEIWLDGGHNPAAAEALAQTLADLQDRAPKPTFLVVGMMAQKDAPGFLGAFKGLVRSIHAVPIPNENASMTAAELRTHATGVGLSAREAATVGDALAAIASETPGPKRILICGSLYLAGDVLASARHV